MTKDLGKLWAERMTKSERDQSFPDSEPRDAATLMLIDRSGMKPKVLLGRRHAGHKFMPGKFVFPGGRIEPLDRKMSAISELHPDAQKKLLERVAESNADFARAFALAAVRETAEETACWASNVTVRRKSQARSGRNSLRRMFTPTWAKSISSRAL
jgi:8-oxo-dGTP pyrophosphatase MutT (NUDIX family)